MPAPILATKLYLPPRRPDVLVRPRLLEQLNEGAKRKLTLVCAPAGFGKTTLVSDWLAGKGEPVAWLSLDDSDSDPARFLSYLIAAIQTTTPELGRGVFDSLQSPQPPPFETLLTVLLNELALVPEPLTIVLDDYHAAEDRQIDYALTFLLDHLPPQLHLVITTREDPQLPTARLRARGELTELRAADLRFTNSEASQFLLDVAGLDLSEEDVARLEGRTEGWVAGLQLAALSMRSVEDTSNFIESFSGSHHFVLDYLVEEVLQQQPDDVQRFLLCTSILDRMSGPLCDSVLNDPTRSGQETLEAIERANLFVVPLDDERRWFRYHHLFRELLRQRLQSRSRAGVNGTEVDEFELHRRASQWYEDNGSRIEAFRHAAAAGDVERAERLVEGSGLPMHLRGSAAPVLQWLQSLPEAVLNDRPSLWVLYSSALLVSGRNVEAEEKLEAVEAALRGTEQDDVNRDLFGRVASLRATMAVMQNDHEMVLSQAQRALEQLDADNLADRTAATWTLGYAHKLHGDREAAGRAFSEVIALGKPLGESLYTMAATLTLGQLQEADNRLSVAMETYRRVLQLAGDPPQLMACEAHLGLARIHYQRNDLSAAHRHAKQCRELVRQTQGIDTLATCGVLQARLRLAIGDLPGAVSLLDEAEEYTRQHGFLAPLSQIASVRVSTLLRQGELEAAAKLAGSYDVPASRARVHLAVRKPEAALGVLEGWLRQAEAKGWADQRLEALVLIAVAQQELGEAEESVRTVAKALDLAEPGVLIRIFLDEGPPMMRLLSRAAERDLVPPALATLRTEVAGAEQTGSGVESVPGHKPEQPLVEPLTERELQVLRLIAQGLSNKEISEELYRALDTVKGHSRRIYDKLEVQSRTEAVARARELGLL